MQAKLEFYKKTFGLTDDEIEDLICKHNGDISKIINDIISAPSGC